MDANGPSTTRGKGGCAVCPQIGVNTRNTTAEHSARVYRGKCRATNRATYRSAIRADVFRARSRQNGHTAQPRQPRYIFTLTSNERTHS